MFTAETFGVEEWHYFDEAVLFVGAWGNEGALKKKELVVVEREEGVVRCAR